MKKIKINGEEGYFYTKKEHNIVLNQTRLIEEVERQLPLLTQGVLQ